MAESLPESLPDPLRPAFRSGAVARRVGMPVATLRTWEQRYQAVKPSTAASGHRLYSAADIERVGLLRRLTEQGHAIGLLAPLDTAHMRQLLQSPAQGPDAVQTPPAMRIVVVGRVLARRLQRLGQPPAGGPALQWVGVFDSLAEAAQAARHSAAPGADLLLWHGASLQPGAAQDLRAAQHAWQAPASAVVYRYANAEDRAALTDMGAALLCEPADDAAWGPWLASLGRAAAVPNASSAPAGTGGLADRPLPAAISGTISAPRFADLALSEFAALPSTLACECPSHLAQLLLQISNFETYSADCAHRNAADAQLHANLQRVAGAARMLFESALEQVALAEGLPLPAGPGAG